MGYVGKMFAEQKMDQKGLSSLLGDQSKMIMQSSPDMVNIVKQFYPTEESKSLIDKLKKSLGS